MSPSASHSFNPAFPDAHQAILPTPSNAGAPRVETAELARLAQCLARVHHECAIVKLEAAPHARPKYRGPRLPPAAQLASTHNDATFRLPDDSMVGDSSIFCRSGVADSCSSFPLAASHRIACCYSDLP